MSSVVDRDLGFKKLLAGLAKLAPVEVEVGIFDGEIADYATRLEVGTSKIPARPWMSTAATENEEKYGQMAARQSQRIIDGATTVQAAAAAIGIEARNDLIDSIQNGNWAPNAPATVKKKGSSKPLVDTGAMQRAITVRVKGAE
jgi:hypothetical protein